jgi:hypothetical protein
VDNHVFENSQFLQITGDLEGATDTQVCDLVRFESIDLLAAKVYAAGIKWN